MATPRTSRTTKPKPTTPANSRISAAARRREAAKKAAKKPASAGVASGAVEQAPTVSDFAAMGRAIANGIAEGLKGAGKSATIGGGGMTIIAGADKLVERSDDELRKEYESMTQPPELGSRNISGFANRSEHAEKARAVGGLQATLGNLNDEISGADELVGRLESLIDSILAPDDEPQEGIHGIDSSGVDSVDYVQMLVERTRAVNRRLTYITDRVRL